MRIYCVLLTLCLAAVSAARSDVDQRIVGGSLTTINAYPMMTVVLAMNLQGTQFRQSCGGSVLNQRSILTAAHCIMGPVHLYRVRLGSSMAHSGGTVFYCDRLILHERAWSPGFDNDIGVIRVRGTIRYSNVIQPANIAGANYNVADNERLWAAGWGFYRIGGPTSEQLRHVELIAMNHARCRQLIGSMLTNNMICAGSTGSGGAGQCSHDSGSPLFHRGTVVGVAAFTSGTCGDLNSPTANMLVSRYTSWIAHNA